MLINKVKQYIIEQGLLTEFEKVIVAVSGGPDSLCLLHLLHTLKADLKIEVIVAHLNHCFRPEAVEESAAVEAVAANLSLPFESARIDVPRYKRGRSLSAQEAAREVRYRFLLATAEKYGAGKIAVGHHRDDQIETVLFNLLRGSGTDGLAGMKSSRPLGSASLIRPLLTVSRQDIEAYCRLHRLQPAYDSSNTKTDYTRNRIRLELIPYLESNYNPSVRDALERTAFLAAADRDFLQEAAGKALTGISRETAEGLLLDREAYQALEPALQGRAARLALERFLAGKRIGWQQVRQLQDLLSGGSQSREIMLPGGIRAYSSYGRVIISSKIPDRVGYLQPVPLEIPGRTALPRGDAISAAICSPAELDWPPSPDQAYLDLELLKKPLLIRQRWPGSYFHPQGAMGGKKLKDFFIDRKVPLSLRDSCPLVTMGDEVIWVVGMRIAHPYRITGETKKALVLEHFHKNRED